MKTLHQKIAIHTFEQITTSSWMHLSTEWAINIKNASCKIFFTVRFFIYFIWKCACVQIWDSNKVIVAWHDFRCIFLILSCCRFLRSVLQLFSIENIGKNKKFEDIINFFFSLLAEIMASWQIFFFILCIFMLSMITIVIFLKFFLQFIVDDMVMISYETLIQSMKNEFLEWKHFNRIVWRKWKSMDYFPLSGLLNLLFGIFRIWPGKICV